MSRVPEFQQRPSDFGWAYQRGKAKAMNIRGLALNDDVGAAAGPARMSSAQGLVALAALGQLTRLEIFRLLMRQGPAGALAGGIADAVGCPHNTVSSHLSILARAGLIHGTRDGRTILYRADIEAMGALLAFLMTDCCDGHPELCDLDSAIGNAVCGCVAPLCP